MKENQHQPASFSFKHHEITKFSFAAPTNERTEMVSIKFFPKGKYNSKTGVFTLMLEFTAEFDENKEFAKINAQGEFQFPVNTPLSGVPDFFYANSIAILFPYLRAFITTLTAVANIKPLILPTLNLSALDSQLKENTKEE
jgi:preprotein translocase subunit SecB